MEVAGRACAGDDHGAGARGRRSASVAWAWSGPEAAAALATRDLATILRVYRRLNRLSQEKAAAALGYDKTYISMIETGRRTIGDVAGRRHVAAVLGLPPYVLGVTDARATDVAAMLQFGESTVRLADVARRSGRAGDAVDELWPLVARLEHLAGTRWIERSGLLLLVRARVALGVSLGTVLPRERLPVAARWTGRGLRAARRLGEDSVLASALRMHGNELRKAGFGAAAVVRLGQAVEASVDRTGRAAALALLARAAGERGDAAAFDAALSGSVHRSGGDSGAEPLIHPFSLAEIELRGLVATGRTAAAVRRLRAPAAAPSPVWQVIGRVTTGCVLLEAGDRSGARDTFRDAVYDAESFGLPQQLQRVVRVARRGSLPDVVVQGGAALSRLAEPAAPTRPG